MIDERILVSKIKDKYKDKTFKELSKMSGLNMTRIFRIFNGSKISYQEALVLQRMVGLKNQHAYNFINDNNVKKVEAKIYQLTKLEKILGVGK